MPYSQRTNGGNISVGGWGCRRVRLTTQGYDRRIVIFHCALEQRTLYFSITGWTQRANLLTVITLPAAHLLRDSNTLKLGRGGNKLAEARSKCSVNQREFVSETTKMRAQTVVWRGVLSDDHQYPPADLADRPAQAKPRRRSTPVLARVESRLHSAGLTVSSQVPPAPAGRGRLRKTILLQPRASVC